MPKHELVSNGGQYATVAERISLFYEWYPRGRIVTRLLSRTKREITVQAFVYRSVEEERPSATGLAAERIGDGDVNTVACLENTETSAIGRALANLGLTASPYRPSREEMARADRARGMRGAEMLRLERIASAAGSARLTTRPVGAAGPSLQRRADRVMDALDVLGQAERAGLPARRGRWLRLVLNDPTTTAALVERIERMLRAWTIARYTRLLL